MTQALEIWLRTEVAAAYDEARANPSTLLSSADVCAKLAALHNSKTLRNANLKARDPLT
jgi:antitoxin ParD1/3/4